MDPSIALVKARAYCARQERCRSELRHKLLAWEVPEEKIDPLLTGLEREGLLNERRFAEHFAISKLRQNGWGKVKIQAALTEKHIGEGAIAFALSSIEAEEYVDAARRIAAKRRDTDEARRLLIGRGFEWDLIDRVLRG